MEQLGGRKFTLAVAAMVALVILGFVKPEAVSTNFIAGLLGLVAAFNVSNVVTTVKSLSTSAPVIEGDAQLSIPVEQLQQQESISDHVKVELMNMQQRLDMTDKQIGTMADIIQKALLTIPKPAQYTNVISQQPQPPEGLNNDYGNNRSQAEVNREAMAQFLQSNFGQGRG